MFPTAQPRHVWTVAATASLALASVLVPAGAQAAAPGGPYPAPANPNVCTHRNNNTYEKLLGCVTVDGVLEHEQAFQAIADANGGTRAAGTTGYTQSVDYVVQTLKAAGWNVELDPFDFTYVPPAQLEQLTPSQATLLTGVFTASGYGEVTGNVIPVDVVLDPPRAPVTSGCEDADFAGLDFSGPA